MGIWYFLQVFWKDGLFKKIAVEHDLSCITWKDGFFFPKIWYFFFGRKMKDDICQETHGNLIFFIYTYRCHTHNVTLPCQKLSKMILPAKIHPKVIDVLDWRPRRSSSNFLYFYGDIYRRLHILLSSEKKPRQT